MQFYFILQIKWNYDHIAKFIASTSNTFSSYFHFSLIFIHFIVQYKYIWYLFCGFIIMRQNINTLFFSMILTEYLYLINKNFHFFIFIYQVLSTKSYQLIYLNNQVLSTDTYYLSTINIIAASTSKKIWYIYFFL